MMTARYMGKTKVTILGASGFFGSHLVPLLKKNKIPTAIFSGDLLDKNKVELFLEKNKPTDAIFLVGDFNPPVANLLEKNVTTLVNFLEIGGKYGLKKIVYASSGAVYGEPVSQQSLEDDKLLPNTLYGLAKLFAEESILYYNRKYNLQYTILRFPNVYGPKNKKGVIYNFLHQIKTNGKLTIAGDGKQTRDFLHITDACVAILKALDYSSSGIFNISNPKNVSINDLVELLKKKYEFKVEKTKSNNDLKNLSLNINLARKQLKFEPKIKEINLPKI